MFRESGALLEGHFVYASGRHGSQFIQAARVMQYPDKLERLCSALAGPVESAGIDLVVGPATGGIVLAEKVPIAATATAGELHDRLADLGAGLIVEALAGLADGTTDPRPQPDGGAGAAPQLSPPPAQLALPAPGASSQRLAHRWSR